MSLLFKLTSLAFVVVLTTSSAAISSNDIFVPLLERDLHKAVAKLSEVQKSCGENLLPLSMSDLEEDISRDTVVIALKHYYLSNDFKCAENEMKEFAFYAHLKNQHLPAERQLRLFDTSMEELYRAKVAYLKIDEATRKKLETQINFQKPFDLVATMNRL